MTFLRKLLVGGFPAMGAMSLTAASGIRVNDGGGVDIAGIKIDNPNHEERLAVIRKAGLDCGTSLNDGDRCTPLWRTGMRINVDGTKEEELYFSSSPVGRLVLRRNNTHSYGLRFTVEGGDIQLGKWSEEAKSIKKLERYESYWLVKEADSDKVYLTRKLTAEKGKMRALGLPEACTLPKENQPNTTCSIDYNQIKNVHFEGKKNIGAIATNNLNDKKVKLIISKSNDSVRFPEGYKFTFVPERELRISNNSHTIKKDTKTDYRVKEWNEENMVLVRAWNNANELAEKVGLKCDLSTNYCAIVEGSLNVKQANGTLKGGSKTTGEGKIKIFRDQENFENGLKFTIEDGDISLSGSTSGSPTINKLTHYDGYEIVDLGGEFYLSRKYEAFAKIIELLGISKNAGNYENNGPVFKTTLPSKHIEKVKFYDDNKVATASGSAAVDVEVYRSGDPTTFKYGYKFTLKANGDVTIGKTKLKKNVSMDFKIREEGGNMYLERAMNPEDLIAKVGLECTKGGDGTETCTFKSGEANVWHWDRSIKGGTAAGGNNVGKLKLTRDAAGYEEGFLFVVEGGDITFVGGNVRMAEFEKYEIQEKKGTWYLYQKRNFMQEKHNSLGIQAECNNSFGDWCKMSGMHVANNINFKVKRGRKTKGYFAGTGEVYMKLFKETIYPTGIKVSMKMVDDNKNISIVCEENESTVLLKLTKDETEFQIEKESDGFYLTKIGGGNSNIECTPPASNN